MTLPTEQSYHPSRNRILWYVYLLPVIDAVLTLGVIKIVSLVQGRPMHDFGLYSFGGFWLSWLGLRILSYGLRAEHLTITVTPETIAGPIRVGRCMPIQFDKIDYQKTLNPSRLERFFFSKRIFSIEGDQIFVQAEFFSPEQIVEIWSILEKASLEHAKLY